MYKKILLSSVALLCASQSFAGWEFRGEPNNWGITPLLPVGGDRHFIRQAFSASQDEFKIAKDGSWAISFPVQNVVVVPGKTYDITFFEGNKTIQADPVPATENWVFRGTPNAWGKTVMVKSGSNYVTCQNFGAAATDPRFRIMNGNKADWVEAYPVGDQRVTANTSFDITFNPATRAITTAARTSTCAAPFVVNIDRSLYIRDLNTLNVTNTSGGPLFGLDRVFTQLATQFNAANPTRPTSAGELFARMWDTQNEGAGFIANARHCDRTLNGFDHRCRPHEGAQAGNAFDSMNKYIPVSIVNRFDLRDKTNFQNCGEARIIYALTNGVGRNFIIFEAQLPNPQPGVANGCRPIADMWKNLTTESSDFSRTTKLVDFFFNGIPSQNVRAVIDIRNYAAATGQIRTNQFMGGDPWVLKEFKLAIENGISTVQPVSVKSNPTGFQFNETVLSDSASQARSIKFRTEFLANMATLVNPDVNKFFLFVQSDVNNNGQSHASGFQAENNFNLHATNNFKTSIQSRAVQLGSTLTTAQILNRATAMTCGGCHNPVAFNLTNADSIGTGKSWPESLGFTHVDENSVVNGKFTISPALLNVFLPARKADFEAFINSTSGAAAAAPSINTQSVPVETTTVTGKRSG